VILTDATRAPEQHRGTRQTLVRVLESALRLLHPIMPYITEEIWQRVAPLAGKTGKTIMHEPYPILDPKQVRSDASDEMRWAMAVITGVRNIRGEMNIAPGKPLPLMLQDGSSVDKKYLKSNLPYLTVLARAESVTWLDSGTDAPESATALIGKMKLLIPLGSLIDKHAELERLGKEVDRIEKELSKAKTKLSNPDFVARAPKHVVDQEHGRVQAFESALVDLRAQHTKVSALPG